MKPRQPTAPTLAALVGSIAGLASTPCTAQDVFPSQPITVVTHASPGGGTDSTARAMMFGTRLALDVDMAGMDLELAHGFSSTSSNSFLSAVLSR